MFFRHLAQLLAVLAVSTAAGARAEKADKAAPAEAGDEVAEAAGEKAQADQKPEALKAIVRGFHSAARVGGGYVLLNSKVADPFGGTTSNEKLGGAFSVGLDIGYDITDMVALQLTGGLSMLSGTRTDRVRDVAAYYVGLMVRFALSLDARWKFPIGVGAGLLITDNRIDENKTGFGAALRAGLEYYVHVRHFSVGVDLEGLAPFGPFRLVLGIQPYLKYTF